MFHADPHAGNILLTENGALGVLDFGKVGKLAPRDRHQILAAFLAIGSRDADRQTKALLALSDGASVGNGDELSLRIGALLDRYADAAIGKIGFEQAMADLIGLFWSHSLVMPGRIILFFKALSMSEGLIRTIEPDARFGQLLARVMKRVLLERIIGAEALHRLASWASHTGAALADLPARGDAALTAATTGELRVRTQLEELAPALSRVEAMVDRLERCSRCWCRCTGSSFRPASPPWRGYDRRHAVLRRPGDLQEDATAMTGGSDLSRSHDAEVLIVGAGPAEDYSSLTGAPTMTRVSS